MIIRERRHKLVDTRSIDFTRKIEFMFRVKATLFKQQKLISAHVNANI